MLETLESCDLVNKDIGVTFTADHVNKNGATSESAIDHVYVSKEINKNVEVKKLLNSASDHFPVILSYDVKRVKICYKRSITKRSLKKFNKEDWNRILLSKDWSSFHNTKEVDRAVSIYTDIVKSALDELAPMNVATLLIANL